MTDNATLLSALHGTHRATRMERVPGYEGERNNCGGDNALCWSENNMLAVRLDVSACVRVCSCENVCSCVCGRVCVCEFVAYMHVQSELFGLSVNIGG